jgi:predicted GNAT family acetyltransferase
MQITVADVPERGRFEIRDDDQVVGFASYHVDDELMTLPHTEIDPAMGGRGLGTQLVAGVLTAARQRHLHVLPYCSFVRKYLLEHPGDLDLVTEADRPTFGLVTASS